MLNKTTDGLTASQSAKQGNKIISSIITSGAALSLLIEQGIRRSIRHGEAFHDVDMAKRFVQAVATIPSVAVNQLVVYIEKRSPIKFEYNAAKTEVVGVKEQKDANGNLVRAYASDEILEQAPFGKEKDLKKQNNKEIEPWSVALYKKRLAQLEQQLVKAGDSDGRGILGPDGLAIKADDPRYQASYNSLFNLIHQHRTSVENMIPLMKAGTPTAALPEAMKTTVITPKDTKPEGDTAEKIAA